MAEDTPVPESEALAAAVSTPAEVLVTLAEEKPVAKEEASPPPPAPEAEEPKKPLPAEERPAEAAVLPEGGEEEEEEKKKKKKKGAGVPLSVYFKEESNVVADLEDAEKKALGELKQLVRDALANREFTRSPPPPPAPKEEAKQKPDAEKPHEEPSPAAPKADERAAEASEAEKENLGEDTKEVEPPKPEGPSSPAKEESLAADAASATEEKPPMVDEDGTKTVEAIEETVVPVATAVAPPTDHMGAPPPPPPSVEEVLLWGVPLTGDGEKSDTVLLKFLRARDFKPKEAMAMLKQTVRWREEFGIEGLLQQEEVIPTPELEKVVFMQGHDRDGHPVCYNVFGEFQNEELYRKVFADEERRRGFLRWRIRLLEKGIREQLDFSPTGVCSMVQVNDLKSFPGLGKRELRVATKQALDLLQDNYPEFVAKQVCINVPWWYMAFHRMISPFLTQRTKSKFVFAGPSRSAEALFEFVAPEQIPVQYGGLSKNDDPDFTTADAVTEFTVKPSTKHTIVIPASEACVLVWELRVLGWDVSYGAEFVPGAEDGYTVIVQKARRYAPAGEEPFVKSSFKAGESGKVVLTVDNRTSKKKKLLYRCKTKKVAGPM